MNKGSERSAGEQDEMPEELCFDHSSARRNRFASRVDAGCIVVALDHDVSQVFRNSADVNKALRALIEAMPARD